MKTFKAFEEFSKNSKIDEALAITEAYQEALRAIHFEIDPKKQEELKLAYGKSTGEVSAKKQIEAADYSLKKFRKEIKFGDGTYLGVFLPGSYDAAVSTLGDGPHKKAVAKVKWSQKKYDQWLEDVASNGGADNAFDMAQNAKNETGLIDWVKKEFRGDDPLQRIQWDIEAFAESVTNEAKNTIGLAFKEEQDYLDFKSFVTEQPRGTIRKNIGFDSKTKSWEVIMDVKVLDDIYGEGHPGNKNSGWYGALPTDFESVIIEGFVSEAFIGPFVFNDTMSDEELKAMYDGALDGYANWQKGFQHPKAKYKQAYQEIEKLLKKRGVEESVVTEGKVLLADLPQKLHDADKADWGSIVKTPYIDGNSITVLVHAGDSSVKKYLNDLIKGFGFKTKFDEVAREGSIHYYTWILLNVDESVVTEGRVANQWDIESHHIGKLQNGKMNKFTEGTGMPFGLISRPEGGLSDTDKNAVKDYVNADNIVLGFYPMEDSNNDTMYDAVKAEGVKVITDLVSKEYGLKLIETIKGKRHCAGDTCSLTHYLVFSKTNESVVNEHSSQDSRELNEGELNSKVAKKLTIGDTIKTDKHTYTITDFGQKANAFRQFQVEDEAGEIYQIQVSLYGSNRIGVGAGRSLNFRDEVLETLVTEAKYVIVVYDNKRLAVDPADIKDLKAGKDVVGNSTIHPGQEEWIHPKMFPWKIEESVVTEAKTAIRAEVMDFLETKLKLVRTSEEFDGAEGGIWTSAENGETLGGSKIFDYYSESSKYEFGVLNKFAKELSKLGWYCEFYDPGTVMIWEE